MTVFTTLTPPNTTYDFELCILNLRLLITNLHNRCIESQYTKVSELARYFYKSAGESE